MTINKKYYAFISYRHADNQEQNRQWATFLHQTIEHYQMPPDLVGQKNKYGETIPDRIYPIFRDEEELPANADLGRAIIKALDETKRLIVICSPKAVASSHVADEIDYFKRQGNSDSIFCAIIRGEPNASLNSGNRQDGIFPSQECFPAPLQVEYDDTGNITQKRAEPIAADFRFNLDGKLIEGWTSPDALQHFLRKNTAWDKKTISRKVDAYRAQQQLMVMKIVAGILGLPLAEFTKRNQEYELQQAHQKAKKLRQWLIAVISLAVIAVLSGVTAYIKQQEAVKNEEIAIEQKNQAQNNLAEAYTEHSRRHISKKEYRKALVYQAQAACLNKDKVELPEAYEMIKNVTRQRWRRPVGMSFDSMPYVTANARFAIGKQGDFISLYDLKKQSRIYQYPENNSGNICVSEDGRRLFDFASRTLIDLEKKKKQSIDYLNTIEFLAGFPNSDGTCILLLTDFGFSVFSITTSKSIYTLSNSDLAKIDPSLNASVVESLNTWGEFWQMKIFSDHWLLVGKNGVTIRLPFDPEKSGAPQILPALIEYNADFNQISTDGNLWAQLPVKLCRVNDCGDFTRVASKMNIWDLKTRKIVRTSPLSVPDGTSDLMADNACEPAKDSDAILTGAKRDLSILVNNLLYDLNGIFFSSVNDVQLLWKNQLLPIDQPYRRAGTSDDNTTNFYLLPTSSKSPIFCKETTSTIHSGKNQPEKRVWIFRGGAEKRAPCDVISMAISCDQRFLVTLSMNGVLSSYWLLTGEPLKLQTLSRCDKNALILPTENCHEIILARPGQITRYNWLTGKTIWSLTDIDDNLIPISGDFNPKSHETVIALLSRDNLWQTDMSDAGLVRLKKDNESTILVLTPSGKENVRLQGHQEIKWFSPSVVKFGKDPNHILISFIGGRLALYDYLGRNETQSWLPEPNGATVTTAVEDYRSNLIYAGDSSGKLYEFSADDWRVITELPMPIVSLYQQGDNLIIETGHNPIFKNQAAFIHSKAILEKDSRRYRYNLSSGIMRELDHFTGENIQFGLQSILCNESVLYLDTGALVRIGPSLLAPVVTKFPSGKEELYRLTDNEFISVKRTGQKVVLATSTHNQTKGLNLDGPREMVHPVITRDNKWAIIFKTNMVKQSAQVYFYNISDLQKAYGIKEKFYYNLEAGVTPLFSYDEKSQSVILCQGSTCYRYKLSDLQPDTLIPAEEIHLTKEATSMELLRDTLWVTTSSGALQRYENTDTGQWQLATEKTERLYSGLLVDRNSEQLLVGGLGALEIRDFSLKTRSRSIDVSFNKGFFPLDIDLKHDFFIIPGQYKRSGVHSRLSIADLAISKTLVSIEWPLSAIFSQRYDQKSRILFWTGLKGESEYWEVGKTVEVMRAWHDLSKDRILDLSTSLTGCRMIDGTVIHDRAALSGCAVSDFFEPLSEKYRQDHFARKNWYSTDHWPLDYSDFMTKDHWQSPFIMKQAHVDTTGNQKEDIKDLEERIKKYLLENKDTGALIADLKTLDKENRYVRLYEAKQALNQNPYSALISASALYREINESKSIDQVLLKNDIACVIIPAAILANEADVAYQMLARHPDTPVPPPLYQQLVITLLNCGEYEKALFVHENLMGIVKRLKVAPPGMPFDDYYNSMTLISDGIKGLDKKRASLPEVPMFCFVFIYPNSPASYADWQAGDCLMAVDEHKSKNLWPGKFFGLFLKALDKPSSKITVWRDGKQHLLSKYGADNGSLWALLGYDGTFVLKVEQIRDDSLLLDCGVQTGDFLVALNGEALHSGPILSHLLQNAEKESELLIFRPEPGGSDTQPSQKIEAVLGLNPLIYWPGTVFKVKLPAVQKLGVLLKPTIVIAPEPIEGE